MGAEARRLAETIERAESASSRRGSPGIGGDQGSRRGAGDRNRLLRQRRRVCPVGNRSVEGDEDGAAAEALAWLAVSSPSKPVRAAAAAALKDQRPHDYVPLLLGAMRIPIQSKFGLYTSSDGGFLVRRVLYADGPEQQQLAIRDINYTPEMRYTRTIGVLKLAANPAAQREAQPVARGRPEASTRGYDRGPGESHGPYPRRGDARRP